MWRGGRQLAGLVAKGNIAGVLETMTPHTLHLIQVMLLGGLVDPEAVIRSTSNNIVCTIARWGEVLQGWLDLFPFLVNMMERGDPAYVAVGKREGVCRPDGSITPNCFANVTRRSKQ